MARVKRLSNEDRARLDDSEREILAALEQMVDDIEQTLEPINSLIRTLNRRAMKPPGS